MDRNAGCAKPAAPARKGTKKTLLWLAVTPDKYELPLCVADTTTELAGMLGISQQAVWKTIMRHAEKEKAGKRVKPSKWRIYRIEV